MLELGGLNSLFEEYPWVHAGVMLAALLVAAWVANWITRQLLLRGVFGVLRRMAQTHHRRLDDHGVSARLANIVPALVIWQGIGSVPNLSEGVVAVVRNVSSAFIILTIGMTMANALNLVNALYSRRPAAANRPTHGYPAAPTITAAAIAVNLR